ncbi:16549_t:CDS:2, partial [Gigaspora rosea]
HVTYSLIVKRQSNRFDIKGSTTDNDEVENDYDFSNFELAYRALDPSKMWVLVEQIFSTNPKQVSKIDKNIVNLLKKYNVDNLPTLQKVIFEPLFSDNALYSTDLDYINLAGVVRNEHLAYLVDPAFHKMETDLIMQQVPFDAIEAGRNEEVTKGTKLLADSLKMSKMLKYMINVLATECNMKEDVLRKLQIAGILQEANMMQSKKVDFEHFLNNYYKNDGFQTPPQNIVFLASSTHITPEKKWG